MHQDAARAELPGLVVVSTGVHCWCDEDSHHLAVAGLLTPLIKGLRMEGVSRRRANLR